MEHYYNALSEIENDFENGESDIQKAFQVQTAIFLNEKNKGNKMYCAICGDLEDLKQLAEPDNRYLCKDCIGAQRSVFNTPLKFKDETENKTKKTNNKPTKEYLKKKMEEAKDRYKKKK